MKLGLGLGLHMRNHVFTGTVGPPSDPTLRMLSIMISGVETALSINIAGVETALTINIT